MIATKPLAASSSPGLLRFSREVVSVSHFLVCILCGCSTQGKWKGCSLTSILQDPILRRRILSTDP